MFFLLRVAFWLTIVLALLPTGSSQPNAAGPQIGATDAVVAAGATVADVSHFCERQAEACTVGSQAAVAIGQRAQAGARMVLDFLTDRVGRIETGWTQESKATPPAHTGSQTTLRPADLAPAWRGPAPQRHAAPQQHSAPHEVVLPRPDPRKAAHRPA